MRTRKLITITICAVVGLTLVTANVSQAAIYQFQVFTNNGLYYDSPDLDLYVDVNDGGAGQVDFTFYNESLIACSMAGIYFDDGSLLTMGSITNGPGTSFGRPASPSNLPGGNELVPPFVTTDEFCMGGDAPAPTNGINPVESGPLEWVKVTFSHSGAFIDVIDELETGDLRIGAHIIALPDGSSESAIVPEPATIALLGFGALVLSRRRTA